VFNHATLNSLGEEITSGVLLGDFEFVLSFSDKTVPSFDRFNMSLDLINDFSAKYDKKIIFAFDEFGDIVKYDRRDLQYG